LTNVGADVAARLKRLPTWKQTVFWVDILDAMRNRLTILEHTTDKE
jgi:hypothetical protein